VEILHDLSPEAYAVENAKASEIWKGEFLKELPQKIVSYYKDNVLYRKHTRLATNVLLNAQRCKNDCGAVREFVINTKICIHHQQVMQPGGYSKTELGRVAPVLLRDILLATE